MATEIRDGLESDLDAIVNVHNSAWRRSYRDLFPEEYLDGETLLKRQRSDWKKRFSPNGPDYPVRLAEVDGTVVGLCCWEPDGAETVELTAIYVTPMHWSTGVGSALQRDARDLWRAQDFKTAYLWTAIANPRAHRSYKKNGWVITDEEKDQKVDGYSIPVHKLTLEL